VLLVGAGGGGANADCLRLSLVLLHPPNTMAAHNPIAEILMFKELSAA
jgi:hypothetical protein